MMSNEQYEKWVFNFKRKIKQDAIKIIPTFCYLVKAFLIERIPQSSSPG